MDSYFIKYFSEERTLRYYAVENKAVDLYNANLKFSQAFYPLLHILEVVLRNSINNVLTDYFNDRDWILNRHIPPQQKQEVEKITNFYRNSTAEITSGKIISELNFSFWTDFFSTNTYKFYKGRPIKFLGNSHRIWVEKIFLFV